MAKLQVRVGILIGILLCTLAGGKAASNVKKRQLRQVHWDAIPYQLGPWAGREERFDPVFGGDPADSSLLRIYTGKDVATVIVYIGFHTDLPTTLDYHTPEVCYPAQGWKVVWGSRCSVGVFRGNWIQAKQIVVDKAEERRLVVWWYHAGSRPFEKRIRQVYRMMALALVTGRTDGAIVRVETPLGNRDEREALGPITEFSRVLLPALENALPQ